VGFPFFLFENNISYFTIHLLVLTSISPEFKAYVDFGRKQVLHAVVFHVNDTKIIQIMPLFSAISTLMHYHSHPFVSVRQDVLLS